MSVGRFKENLKIFPKDMKTSYEIPPGWKRKPFDHRWPFLDVFFYDFEFDREQNELFLYEIGPAHKDDRV